MPAYNTINSPGFMPNAAQQLATGGANFNSYQSIPWNPPQTVVQQTGTGSNLMTIFVNNTDEVNNYPVAAGLTVMLIGFNLGKFWLKSTSTNGVPQPIREFTFTEEVSVSNNQNGGVTREEFKALNEKLDKLIQDLGGAK